MTKVYPSPSVDEVDVIGFLLFGDQVKVGAGTPLAVQVNMRVNPTSLSLVT